MRSNSWAVRIGRNADIEVFAGSRVERLGRMVAEGAWAGEFSEEGFVGSGFRCGSGVVINDDHLLFCAPSHSVEGVYLWKDENGICLSNSVHLIIALFPCAMPSNLSDTRGLVRSLTKGKLAYGRQIHSNPHGTLFRFAFGQARVSLSSLEVQEEISVTWAGSRFAGFVDYKRELSETLLSLIRNAKDTRRHAPYNKLITTCSAGYDSAVCAALATELGAVEALTVRTGRGGTSDTGRHVAEALNLTCHEYERVGEGLEQIPDGSKLHYLPAQNLDYEMCRDFLGTLNTAEDLYFSVFEPHLSGAIVLTGFHGDKIWAKGCPSGSEIVRGDSSGTGLDEFRKRVGFVNVPVPYIGSDFPDDISRISGSEDMRAWSVPYDYNRPIPRRIAEEAGVPREAFGRKKSAGSVLISNATELRLQAFNELVSDYRGGLN